MAKKRLGEPWMSSGEYGRSLPQFTVNLIVSDIRRSAAFYASVLGATVRYADADFAALEIQEIRVMLHADHTYERHPWYPQLCRGESRGLGAELRLLGLDPDVVEAQARSSGAPVLQPATLRAHGWRDVIVADPDGYTWAVGLKTTESV